jgi:HD-like signal output (HDOD) protein
MTAAVETRSLIEHAKALTPLPASVSRLASVVADDKSDLDDIVQVVRLDQGLTARVLSAANSATKGRGMALGTVEQAVMRLGRGCVLSIAVGSAVRSELTSELPQYKLSEGELWRHSVAAALVAEHANRYCTKVKVPAETFTAALLHDVGKLVLCRFLDDTVLDLLSRSAGDRGVADVTAEREILEVTHGELGGLIVQDWGLSEDIRIGVAYHHEPDVVQHLFADVVHVCDTLAKRIQGDRDLTAWSSRKALSEAKASPVEHPIDAGVVERLGLNTSGEAALSEKVAEKLVDVYARYE